LSGTGLAVGVVITTRVVRLGTQPVGNHLPSRALLRTLGTLSGNGGKKLILRSSLALIFSLSEA